MTGETHVRLAWAQITVAYAYKRDCFSVDRIRLVLGDEIQRRWIEISEDDGGYEQLVMELPRHLPGCLTADDWQGSVALPPFETQWTSLYRRGGATAT